VDVVAAEHGRAEVEKAVAEAVAGFHERLPGEGVARPADEQAPAFLERGDGRAGRRSERAALGAVDGMSCRGQATLDVGDRRAAVTRPQGEVVVVDGGARRVR
jgi:hypothetical protein